MTRKRGAARPAPRTIEVALNGTSQYPGWQATCRVDFPARLALEMESGQLARVLAALEVIVVDHNMPDSEGNVAEHLADVDPYSGLIAIANALTEAIASVPPR